MKHSCNKNETFLKHFVNNYAIPLNTLNTYDMHRGEWIEKKMKEFGYSIDRISIELNIGRTTLWRWLGDEKLPYLKMKKVADLMKIDLRIDFPETIELYGKSQKDYEKLYLKELEHVRELQEELAKCRELKGV
jgi:hypothetical protein